MPLSTPAPPTADFTGGWYNVTATLPGAAKAQLDARQAKYNVSWRAEDYDAPWVVHSRLLLYPYIARPTPALARPRVLVDGAEKPVVPSYNSRGNHAVVAPGGGAASGNTARTFLGFYVDCSALEPDVPHRVDVWLPRLEKGQFAGLFWHGLEDEVTAQIGGQ